MPDLIELRGLRALGFCGALPEEQERRQPFEVDADIETDLAAAGASDELGDTVDYGALCARIESVIVDERFVLLERMAARLAEVLLADARIEGVRITVRKLRPPVPQQLDTSGVTIRRGRS